jgi:hypothetical protein
LKILITGGKSAGALKLLKAFKNDEVVLADYGDVPVFSATSYQFISLGQKNEDTLAHTLLNHCLDNQVEIILPIHAFEIEPLAKAEILFNEFNVDILLPSMNAYEGYMNVGVSKANWVIYQKGAVRFSTQEAEEIPAYGKAHLLSGAFYFEMLDKELKLSLITI